ncbi:MAG: DNA-directed RNA polymerase subunit omega [Baileyella intestinalis]|uniref:DNA-directed RNA polymerase subunit omega n=1 Tax=Baileyella intestinalis TaxID=2606709 RepID=UPI002A75AA8D|nr:DNA-directed RNA polymerase subunit omega [Baileyella intestinalis]MCI7685366.1 DNA-directed RNA polymerase subunit omega [Clostridiales bacterium]MDY2995643.1 DNA-directed RNA polymerase subunit omega [Baileyella intestinalis]
MLLYPSINELTEKADSKYTLAMLAAKRARDIIDGKPVLTEHEKERPVSTATYEISEDLITYRRVEEEEVQTEPVHVSETDISDDETDEDESEEGSDEESEAGDEEAEDTEEE